MKVLIAIDSSQYADEILQQLVMRFWPADAEFHVVTAVEHCADADAQHQFLHQGQIILDDRVQALIKRVPNNRVTSEVIEGTAVHAITKTAAQWKADLIVIGSHGDTGTRKTEVGSVAAAVVDTAPCSVEVVKLRKGSKNLISSGASKHENHTGN